MDSTDNTLNADDPNIYQTPSKSRVTYHRRRKTRESLLSPGSIRLGKMARTKDDAIYEKIEILLKAEMHCMKNDLERDLYGDIYAKIIEDMNAKTLEMHAMMKQEAQQCTRDAIKEAEANMQTTIKSEIAGREAVMQKRYRDNMAKELQQAKEEMQKSMRDCFQLWKREQAKCMEEKEDEIKALQAELQNCKKELEGHKQEMHTAIAPQVQEEIQGLKEELQNCKKTLEDHGKDKNTVITPQLQEEIKELKVHVEKELKSFAEVTKKTQVEIEENAKWIDVVKKNKGIPANKIEVMNATLEEETKRKVRALHVRVTGWNEKHSPQEDAKALATKIGAQDVPILDTWRAGKDPSKPRALIIKFTDMDTRRAFLSKRGALKGEKIYLDDDLTPAQVAHRKEHMPRVLEARKEGKWAVYREGKVIITERRSA